MLWNAGKRGAVHWGRFVARSLRAAISDQDLAERDRFCRAVGVGDVLGTATAVLSRISKRDSLTRNVPLLENDFFFFFAERIYFLDDELSNRLIGGQLR